MSGGNSLFKGLPKRLEAEMSNLAPAKMKVKMTAPEERKFSVWIGGAILSNLSSFKEKIITKAEFEEFGA